jgi:hypothetical protein
MSNGLGDRLARLELIATVLLALATVATAWSSYQASRWNAEQAKAAAAANALRISSTKFDALANTETQVDVATFSSWADAYARSETGLADFYRRRFRREFKPAVDAWIATRPLQNSQAPLTPFAMPQYRLAARAEAQRADARAAASTAKALRDVQRSTNYILCAVLFAAALFFAGMSARLASTTMRRMLLAIGVLVFLATVVWIATFPVSFSM